jgi:hypothetical protein
MIIEANGKYYTTTIHAEERMLVKNITESQIKQTIEQGRADLTELGDDIYFLEISGREIAVIIVDDERIKTVFEVE